MHVKAGSSSTFLSFVAVMVMMLLISSGNGVSARSAEAISLGVNQFTGDETVGIGIKQMAMSGLTDVDPEIDCLACHKLVGERIVTVKDRDLIVNRVDCSSCHGEVEVRPMEAAYNAETQSLNMVHKMDCSQCHSQQAKEDDVIQITGKDNAPMMLIPSGGFSIGDYWGVGHSDEKQSCIVHLDAFYMDAHEVTNAQYARFLNQLGGHIDASGHTLLDIGKKHCLIEKVGNSYKPKDGYADYPVVCVSWYGATAYAKFHGERLPTEAEWEKAARGGLVGKLYPWGDDVPDGTLCNFADKSTGYGWVNVKNDDGYKRSAPVCSFSANGYGLYYMAGNVWEWCGNEYEPIETSITVANTKTPTNYVLRGGSWRSAGKCLRNANRTRRPPHVAYQNTGFRCVQNTE
jgi:formylglycine-generating enzyme required for sulfatase activity